MAAVEGTIEGAAAFDFADEAWAGDGVAVPGLVFEVTTGDGVDEEEAFGAVAGAELVAAAGEAA